MPAIQLLSSQPWVERLGWTLVHFLWEGTLIAALYTIVLRWIARSSLPSTRYVFGCIVLAIMMAAPLVTWSLLGASESVRPALSLDSAAAAASPRASAVASLVSEAIRASQRS